MRCCLSRHTYTSIRDILSVGATFVLARPCPSTTQAGDHQGRPYGGFRYLASIVYRYVHAIGSVEIEWAAGL